MNETRGGKDGTGAASVFLLDSLDIRRNPFLTFAMFDFLDDTELIDVEVMDVAVREGVFLCLCCSIDASDTVCVD